MIRTESEIVETKNGHQLVSISYFPEGDVVGAVLVVPAMGVTQKYYRAFSSWLASQGYIVSTFDYYGTGQSLVGNMRDVSVTITDWAQYDCTAMLEAVENKAEGAPVYWVGHSLGGQILGLVPDHRIVTKAINIASGSGYWLENTASLKWRVWWLWYFVVPVAIKICGYFPGARLRKVGNLPKGVMSQWRNWCLDPEYVVGFEGQKVRDSYSEVAMPISSFSFTDDELMSKRNIESLNSFYSTSKINSNRISPEDVGTNKIGHFGFFKEKNRNSLWSDYLLPELN